MSYQEYERAYFALDDRIDDLQDELGFAMGYGSGKAKIKNLKARIARLRKQRDALVRP